jgi:hypothetical protein
MTKAECLSKFEYHIALAEEAARSGNWADMDLEEARAELAFTYAQRLA